MKKEGYIQYDSFQVAGYDYYDGLTILYKLKEGEELKLVRDAFNPFDHRAVEVKTSYDIKLGFVPRKRNRMTAFFMDNDIPILAVIREVQHSENSTEPIRVDLFVSDKIKEN